MKSTYSNAKQILATFLIKATLLNQAVLWVILLKKMPPASIEEQNTLSAGSCEERHLAKRR